MNKCFRWSVALGCGLTLGGLLCGTAGAQAEELRACGGQPGAPAWVKDGVYSGQIGALPVVMQLSRKDTDTDAYFYRSKGIDLKLSPFQQGNTLLLQEAYWSIDQLQWVASGCFALKASGQALTGQWTTPDRSKAQPVTLRPLNVAALPLALPSSPELLRLRREEPLTFVKLNRPWDRVPGGLKAPYTGVVFPLPAQATPALSTTLQDWRLSTSADALSCLAGGVSTGGSNKVYYTSDTKVEHQTPHLLSVSETGDAYCGGMHPSLIFSASTLDRNTGKAFAPAALWPSLTTARLQQLYDQGLTDKDCQGQTNPDLQRDLQTMLTDKGLDIYNNNYPEVVRFCRSLEVTLPYATLRAEANPKSPYFRDIYPR